MPRVRAQRFGSPVDTLSSDEDVIQRHLDKIFPVLFGRIFAPFAMWHIRRSAAGRRLAASIAEVSVAVDGFRSPRRTRRTAASTTGWSRATC